MITGPANLGIMVGTDVAACPAGWIFIPCDKLNKELLYSAYGMLSRGRDGWPKAKANVKKLRNMTEEERQAAMLAALRDDEYFGATIEEATE